jgi:hypothetical protein
MIEFGGNGKFYLRYLRAEGDQFSSTIERSTGSVYGSILFAHETVRGRGMLAQLKLCRHRKLKLVGELRKAGRGFSV